MYPTECLGGPRANTGVLSWADFLKHHGCVIDLQRHHLLAGGGGGGGGGSCPATISDSDTRNTLCLSRSDNGNAEQYKVQVQVQLSKEEGGSIEDFTRG